MPKFSLRSNLTESPSNFHKNVNSLCPKFQINKKEQFSLSQKGPHTLINWFSILFRRMYHPESVNAESMTFYQCVFYDKIQ